MDANGSRFHLLQGYRDWAACLTEAGAPLAAHWQPNGTPTSVEYDPRREELMLTRVLYRFPAAPNDRPPSLSDRRGAAQDRYGNWYWISPDEQAIHVLSSGSGSVSIFWPEPPAAPSPPPQGSFQPVVPPAAPAALRLCGLAVTSEHYLAVGTHGPAGLLLFDLHAGGPPRHLLWPIAASLQPFDLAADDQGGLWVLDRAARRLWRLDRSFAVVRRAQVPVQLAAAEMDQFHPIGSQIGQRAERTFPAGIPVGDATADLIAVEALPDGTALVLGRLPGDRTALWQARLGQPAPTVDELPVTAHDMVFIPDANLPARGQLLVADAQGNQAFAFTVTRAAGAWQIAPVHPPIFLPMRLFTGRGLVAANGQAFYDCQDQWTPLVAQIRPRDVTEATLLTPLTTPGTQGSDRPAFDGRAPDCVWHRLFIDGWLPPDTDVEVWSRAANDETLLAVTPWQAEPRLYRRSDGPELPYAPAPQGLGGGSWELLLQHAKGRYLQLKLRLTGSGRATPRLRALRVYCPRFSYLEHYLPATYRADGESAAFLEGFLANFEGFYTALEDKIAAVQQLFDVRSAPAETLDWLVSWFGVVFDPAWDETRRRLFIQHAMTFFAYRGTVPGLLMALRLTLDPCVDAALFAESLQGQLRPGGLRIVEKFLTRRAPPAAAGDPTIIGPALVPVQERWTPDQGGAALHAAYRQAQGLPAAARFPVHEPEGSAGPAWRAFCERKLGFVPSLGPAHQARWQAFLERRYRQIGALNTSYQRASAASYTSFAQVEPPSTLPADGAPLYDWHAFETVVMTMQQTAHRFSVLLPMPTTATRDVAIFQERINLARRVVELEKPVHTVFDIKFFWALFRVGEARLGLDTQLDMGSRMAHLLPPMVLGQEHLAESYLAPGHPYNVSDRRFVLGRDGAGSY